MLTIGYLQEEKKEKKKLNWFALANSLVGIPTIAFIILLLAKGIISDYLVIVYIGLFAITTGVFYSLFKIINR
ncbi:MAG: hypothetical protein ACFFDS_02255 [Candidatus Thorarchaeota archaeon]